MLIAVYIHLEYVILKLIKRLVFRVKNMNKFLERSIIELLVVHKVERKREEWTCSLKGIQVCDRQN